MISNTHDAIMRHSTKLVEKRNNFLKSNIAHLPEEDQRAILEKKEEVARRYSEKIRGMLIQF